MNNICSLKMNRQHFHSIILLVLAAMLWSSAGFLIKLISWNPIAIAGMRSGIAALVMLCLYKDIKFSWTPAQIGAAMSYASTVILFVVANKLTTSTNAIMLQYSAPIYVALFSSWTLKEKVRLLDWTTIILVLTGIVLFFFDQLSPGGILGNILAIFSGLSFALLAIFMRKQKNEPTLGSLLLGNIFTAVVGLPFMFQSMPSATSWLGLIFLGVFQLGLSYVLYAKAMKHATALEGVLIPIIEPILNPIWVFILTGEQPGFWALIGGLIVLVSVSFRCVVSTLKDTSHHT